MRVRSWAFFVSALAALTSFFALSTSVFFASWSEYCMYHMTPKATVVSTKNTRAKIRGVLVSLGALLAMGSSVGSAKGVRRGRVGGNGLYAVHLILEHKRTGGRVNSKGPAGDRTGGGCTAGAGRAGGDGGGGEKPATRPPP